MNDEIIADNYFLGKLIGKGSFGKTYEGYYINVGPTYSPNSQWLSKL